MLTMACEKCGKGFQEKLAPCPDGRGFDCGMAHFDDQSWICPHCGHDNKEKALKSWREGPQVDAIGIGVGNLKAIKKLEITTKEES